MAASVVGSPAGMSAVLREGLGSVTKPGSPVTSGDLEANSPRKVTGDSAEPGLRSGKATMPLGPGVDHPP